MTGPSFDLVDLVAKLAPVAVAAAAWFSIARGLAKAYVGLETKVAVLTSEVESDRDAARERGGSYAASLSGIQVDVVGIRGDVRELQATVIAGFASTGERCIAHDARINRLERAINGER